MPGFIFYPDIMIRRVTDIKIEHLTALGVKGLLLDVDNTLAKHQSKEPVEGINEWITYMRDGGIKITVISNNKKSRVAPFAEGLTLGYISMAMKPFASGYIRAAKYLGLKRSEVAIAGDQIFTDVAGGRLAGTKAILLEPIEPETGPWFRARRFMERHLISRYAEKYPDKYLI